MGDDESSSFPMDKIGSEDGRGTRSFIKRGPRMSTDSELDERVSGFSLSLEQEG
jgi:hypothetical protein